MKAIRVENPGAEYRLAVSDIDRPAPKPGEVLIRVAAAGLNHADMIQAKGGYPPPPGAPDTLGLEVSGEIVEIGAGVTGLKVGDKVCALLGGGGYAEYAAVSQLCVLPIPKGVSLIDAAALPEVHFTVWTNLMDAARLKPGERVLVHGGTSGIGTAAIQLCVARGHEVFATAGSKEKCAACEKLGAKAINYREQDFVDVIKTATGGKGVDVILDMVGGDYVDRELKLLADDGRIVLIAFLGGMKSTVSLNEILRRRLVLTGSTLRPRPIAFKGEIARNLREKVWPKIASGAFKPEIFKTFALADAAQAHALMESSQHIGKIVLTV